jgi:hypothetical protein
MEIINGKIVFDTLIAEPGKDLHNEGYVKHGKSPQGGQRWIRKAKRNAYDREKYRLKKEKEKEVMVE